MYKVYEACVGRPAVTLFDAQQAHKPSGSVGSNGWTPGVSLRVFNNHAAATKNLEEALCFLAANGERVVSVVSPSSMIGIQIITEPITVAKPVAGPSAYDLSDPRHPARRARGLGRKR